MFERLGRIAATGGVTLRRALIGTTGIFVVLIILVLANRGSLFWMTQGYVDQLTNALGLNPHLGNALFWISLPLVIFFASLAVSLDGKRRRLGFLGIISILAAHSLALWFATKDKPFARGLASKCYVVTREEIRYGEAPGIDPVTGIDCKPVTPEIVERIERYKTGSRPTRISSASPTFYDPRTGNPITWYSVTATNRIEIFDLMGFHPDTGVPLLPISPEVVTKWKDQQALEARKPPSRVYPNANGPWFDPVDGRALVWFMRAPDGGYEFFDREGFDPQSGAKLERVTRDNLDEIRRNLADRQSRRCFVLTPNAVRYRSEVGTDPETGRECREVTVDLLPRLKEYEQGKRPNLIETKTPIMFDPRSGEPIVWYWKGSDGNIELYDLMGFHPRTGDELLPITRAAAEAFEGQSRAPKAAPRAPKMIDPRASDCFDAMTGEPRCWFWKSPNGSVEFFDGPGFHPKFGDPLEQVTKQVVLKLEEEALARKKALEEEQKARDKEKEKLREDIEREERKREDERRKAPLLAKKCDELAANPNDRNRVGPGVPLATIEANGSDAVKACEEAVRQAPTELRFSYQLARALWFSDRPRAYRILEDLVRKGYPAAHDNLGSLLYVDKKNISGALQVYRKGVALGDPDSIVSLAELIGKKLATSRDPSETKANLYAQACQLGHQRACQAAEFEAEAERKRLLEIQQQQKILELFGGILRAIPGKQ